MKQKLQTMAKISAKVLANFILLCVLGIGLSLIVFIVGLYRLPTTSGIILSLGSIICALLFFLTVRTISINKALHYLAQSQLLIPLISRLVDKGHIQAQRLVEKLPTDHPIFIKSKPLLMAEKNAKIVTWAQAHLLKKVYLEHIDFRNDSDQIKADLTNTINHQFGEHFKSSYKNYMLCFVLLIITIIVGTYF